MVSKAMGNGKGIAKRWAMQSSPVRGRDRSYMMDDSKDVASAAIASGANDRTNIVFGLVREAAAVSERGSAASLVRGDARYAVEGWLIAAGLYKAAYMVASDPIYVAMMGGGEKIYDLVSRLDAQYRACLEGAVKVRDVDDG